MEAVFKNMDFLVKHWAPFARRHPAPFPLISTDFIRAKNHWVRHSFDSCNFSLILRGRGEFHRHGKKWMVEAPCVITQWPGDFVEYGPSGAGGTWTELYLIYAKKNFTALCKSGLLNPELPVWPVSDINSLAGPLAEMAVLTKSRDPEAVADRMDRVSERLILETWFKPRLPESPTSRMQALLVELQESLEEGIHFEAMAERHGMSGSTFRRRWSETFEFPPARYLQELRMQKACRLLVESSLPIREIAGQSGFKDEFYFSRRFHLENGMSPRDYRKTYRLNRI